MTDKTRWLLNADIFPKEDMSMTSEMVQGHPDVGLRDKLKNIWNEKDAVRERGEGGGGHVCVHTLGYCYYHVHDKNVNVKIRMREYDRTSIAEL